MAGTRTCDASEKSIAVMPAKIRRPTIEKNQTRRRTIFQSAFAPEALITRAYFSPSDLM